VGQNFTFTWTNKGNQTTQIVTSNEHDDIAISTTEEISKIVTTTERIEHIIIYDCSGETTNSYEPLTIMFTFGKHNS